MKITLPKIIIVSVLLIGGFFAIRTVGGIQVARSMTKCMKTMSESKPKPNFKNENEARAYVDELIDCMDKNNGFFARLIFNKEEEKRNVTFSP